MSRADSKTQLQTKIAKVQKNIDWETNVNGDYNMLQTTILILQRLITLV